jgi:hypothetical protein
MAENFEDAPSAAQLQLLKNLCEASLEGEEVHIVWSAGYGGDNTLLTVRRIASWIYRQGEFHGQETEDEPDFVSSASIANQDTIIDLDFADRDPDDPFSNFRVGVSDGGSVFALSDAVFLQNKYAAARHLEVVGTSVGNYIDTLIGILYNSPPNLDNETEGLIRYLASNAQQSEAFSQADEEPYPLESGRSLAAPLVDCAFRGGVELVQFQAINPIDHERAVIVSRDPLPQLLEIGEGKTQEQKVIYTERRGNDARPHERAESLAFFEQGPPQFKITRRFEKEPMGHKEEVLVDKEADSDDFSRILTHMQAAKRDGGSQFAD